MNTLMKVFLFALLASLVNCQQEEAEAANDSIQLQGIGRLLAQKKKSTSRVLAVTSCNVYPKICSRVKGSPGRDCCKNKCVNMETDRLNCGECGHKCKYLEMCCKGKCVNPMNDKDNCGSCSNKCNHRSHKKSKCVFGMCSYA